MTRARAAGCGVKFLLAAVVLFYKGCINRLFVSLVLWTNELPRSGKKKNIVIAARYECIVMVGGNGN